MDASVSVGIALTVASGLLGTVQLIYTRLLERWGLPFFRIHCVTLAAVVICILTALAAFRVSPPNLRQFKWLTAMSLLGFGSFICATMAVWWGTPPGDVASLQSINVVVAAILGRLFLGEALGSAHVLAGLCSLVGALLIAQPTFLFGGGGGRDPKASLGWLLAPVSGILLAMSFVCTRMMGTLNMFILPAGMLSVSALGFTVLALVMDDGTTWGSLVEEPWEIAACIGFNFIASLLAISTKYMGPKLCPAAVSATVFTASSMLSGYLGQVLLFNLVPSAYTICGAGLMLIAVVVMTLARKSPAAAAKIAQAAGAAPPLWPSEPSSGGWDDVESTISVASFIASEFATEFGAVPRRPAAATPAPSPKCVGVVATAV